MRHLKLHRPSFLLRFNLCLLPLLIAPLAIGQEAVTPRHQDPQWASIRQHLVDPATASAEQLESQGDLLRARRFPEDALLYYDLALQRKHNSVSLLNKIGITQLELHNFGYAEQSFARATKVDRKAVEAWNNLGAVEYLQRRYNYAVGYYKRALKLNKKSAVFHVNLSTAYFEMKDYKNSMKQAADALNLDPLIYEQDSGVGSVVHVLSIEDRARFNFEMAKLYAQQGKEEEMLHALAKASEGGFDILAAMARDPNLSKYRNDPRVEQLVVTAKEMREGTAPIATSSAALGPKKMVPLPTPAGAP